MRLVALASLFLVVGAGCLDLSSEEEIHGTEQETGLGCQDDFCPKNSSVIDTYVFHELSLNPAVTNAQGFSVKYLQKGTIKYTLRVVNGRISGRNLWFGNISGAALQNSFLWVTRAGVDYAVWITQVVNVPMWAKLPPPAVTPTIEAYKMDWSRIIGTPSQRETHNICEEAQLPRESGDLLGAPGYVSFVFEGERIDSKSKRIFDYDKTWFDVGCAGHILAKLHQTGHTQATEVLGYHKTLDQEQTMISAYGATYCGDGYSFTVPGISLTLFDENKWMEYPAAPGGIKLEGRWKGLAPTCLDTPRVNMHPTADSVTEFGWDVEDDIMMHPGCTRPAFCADSDPWNLDGYHLATAHPIP